MTTDQNPRAPRTIEPSAPAPNPSQSNSMQEGTRLIYLGIASFVCVCVFLLVAPQVLHPEESSEPGFPIREKAESLGDGTHRITLDTSSEERWVSVDLKAGLAGHRGGKFPDLFIRRYTLQAPYGAIDLGPVELSSAIIPTHPEWQYDETIQGTRQSPAFYRWYAYSYWTHLLSSKGHTYALRLGASNYALVQVISYYCEPDDRGCLTLRYKLL